MDEPRTVPAGDALIPIRFSDADDFPEKGMETVDVPGVGPCVLVDTGDSAVAELRPVRATLPGKPYVAGEVPQPLRDYVDGVSPFRAEPVESDDDSEQNRALIELLFAAKDVAEQCVVPIASQLGPMSHCLCCRKDWPRGADPAIWHMPTCLAARLIRAIEQVFAVYHHGESVQSNPTGKDGVARADSLNSAGAAGTPARRASCAEVEALAYQLADEDAEVMLNSCTLTVEADGVKWMVLNATAEECVKDELRYLELRGALVRCHFDPERMVRVVWPEGGAR